MGRSSSRRRRRGAEEGGDREGEEEEEEEAEEEEESCGCVRSKGLALTHRRSLTYTHGRLTSRFRVSRSAH